MSRQTQQRSAITEALHEADGFLTIQQLHDRLRRAGHKVGLATVYRNVQALARGGEIDSLRNEDGEAIYRRCTSSSHHHHVVCTSCGRSVEVASDEIEAWAERTAARHGFTSVTHTAEVYGLCRRCS